MADQSYTKGFVTSKDGTTIGYRQMGSGPDIILLHGGANASQSFMKLGQALSDEFTVYIPDRRGRGLSGPFGENYSLQKEVEDIDALLEKTSAQYLFGGSTGGLIALQASITLPEIHKIVTYEPLIYVNKKEMDQFNAIVQRFDQQLAEGELTTAMVTSLNVYNINPEDSKPLLFHLPGLIWKPIFRMILEVDERNVKGDDVTIKELMPTLKNDVQLVDETEGKIDNFKNVSAEVLLLNGSKSASILKESLDALEKILPHSKRKELHGLDHDSAQNYGKPEIIAQEIKSFLEKK